MFEWLRKMSGGVATDRHEHHEGADVYRVEFDRMQKGAIVLRRGKPIRQLGITMDGSTRLITSGDFVDRETYDRLLATGVLAPSPHDPPKELPKDIQRAKSFPHSTEKPKGVAEG